MTNIFISDAFAQAVTDAAPAAGGASLTNFIPLILIFAVFYFLLVRPQQKKMKEHQNTLANLKNGDKVFTTSGIAGTIKSIDDKDNTVELEISDNVVIKILKQSIGDLLNKEKKEKDHAHTKTPKKKK